MVERCVTLTTIISLDFVKRFHVNVTEKDVDKMSLAKTLCIVILSVFTMVSLSTSSVAGDFEETFEFLLFGDNDPDYRKVEYGKCIAKVTYRGKTIIPNCCETLKAPADIEEIYNFNLVNWKTLKTQTVVVPEFKLSCGKPCYRHIVTALTDEGRSQDYETKEIVIFALPDPSRKLNAFRVLAKACPGKKTRF